MQERDEDEAKKKEDGDERERGTQLNLTQSFLAS